MHILGSAIGLRVKGLWPTAILEHAQLWKGFQINLIRGGVDWFDENTKPENPGIGIDS